MSSRRRGGGVDMNPKLHMDRQPTVTRINGEYLLNLLRLRLINLWN